MSLFSSTLSLGEVKIGKTTQYPHLILRQFSRLMIVENRYQTWLPLVWIQFCSRFHSQFLSGIFQRIISYFRDEIPTLPLPPHGQENHPPKTHPFTSSSLSAYQTLTTSSKVASYCSLTAHQPPSRQRFGWKIRHVNNVRIGFILKFHIGLTLFTLTFWYWLRPQPGWHSLWGPSRYSYIWWQFESRCKLWWLLRWLKSGLFACEASA